MATPDLQNLFAGLHMTGAGVGIEDTGSGQAPMAGPGALGDEAAVMMISGLDGHVGNMVASANGKIVDTGGTVFSLWAALSAPVSFLGVTLPLWAWVAAIVGAVGLAGWFFFIRGK